MEGTPESGASAPPEAASLLVSAAASGGKYAIRACQNCSEVRPLVAYGLCTRCNQRRPAVKAYQQRKRAEDARRVTDFVWEQKKGPCSDCGVSYPPYVMDFDHRPGEPKSLAVSQITRQFRGERGIALAREEIAKCDLVCSNCHRIRTYQRSLSGRND